MYTVQVYICVHKKYTTQLTLCFSLLLYWIQNYWSKFMQFYLINACLGNVLLMSCQICVVLLQTFPNAMYCSQYKLF